MSMDKKASKKNQRGFSLMELLIGVSLLAVVTVLVNNVLFSIFKGTVKSEVLKGVKQNGDYALSVMEQRIRNAREVVVCNAGMNNLTIKNQDATETEFLVELNEGVNKIKAGSNYLTPKTVTVSSGITFNCTQNSGEAPKVNISFTLQQARTSSRSEEKADINFQTTVILRNY